MGLFQQRPEEPTEWAGLPSDPWQPRPHADHLPDNPGAALPTFGEGTVSIEIPASLPPEAAGFDGE